MRRAFIETLKELAAEEDKIFLLCGDVGFGVLEEFQQKYPKRFLNVGIAEQNAVSMSTGMALEGKIPVVYTINNFLVFRALEQIRMLGSMKQHVILVGVGINEEYTNQGISHYAFGDEEILKTIPNLKVLTPKTKKEVQKIMKQVISQPGTYYIRLSRFGGK